MQKYNLSKRMAAVARLVPCGVSACDIGCDHGFVAIYLVREHICPRVIAMDINRGPLSRAREHIESAGLSSYIETRLSDGMEKLNIGEADCIIAAGMGGRLTVKILNDFPEKRKSLRYLVLQPQSELAFVRRYLRSEGLVIRKEDMVLEDGKFYPMMLVEVGKPGREDGISGREREPGREPKTESPQMAFYRITSLEELRKGYRGIPEPSGETQEYIYTPELAERTLMLMPGVAFDRFQNRIGYGKGFYDRYLADKPGLQLRTIAVGHRCQMVEELPVTATDIRPYQVICV